ERDASAGPRAESRESRWSHGLTIGRIVKTEDVMNFSRQLASFITSGVPINDALGIVAEECGSKHLGAVLLDVQRRLRTGSTFGDSIGAHPRVFPGYYVAIVRAAEMTGHLD